MNRGQITSLLDLKCVIFASGDLHVPKSSSCEIVHSAFFLKGVDEVPSYKKTLNWSTSRAELSMV